MSWSFGSLATKLDDLFLLFPSFRYLHYNREYFLLCEYAGIVTMRPWLKL